jgi:hypothetical protein
VIAVIRDHVGPAAVAAARVVEASIPPEGEDAVDDDRNDDEDFHTFTISYGCRISRPTLTTTAQ